MIQFDFENPPTRMLTLIVETTTLCSLKCAGCLRTRSEVIGKWVDHHMTAAQFRRIIDNAPAADAICVQGIGEPTLNPDFPEIVRLARASGKYESIFFSTHGLARDAGYFERLVSAGVTSFRVSVDSLDPDNAQRLRAGTDVDKLRRRLVEFAALKLPFGISITVSKHNLTELPDLLGDLNAIGRDHRFVVGMHNFIYNEYEENVGAPNYASWVLDLADTRRIASEIDGWRAQFPNLALEYADYYDGAVNAEIGICDAPRTMAWIGVDGLWGICCFYPDPKVLGSISIEDNSFNDAWRSAGAQAVLQNYAVTSPAFCDHCPKNCGRQSTAKGL
ncbi:MAG TPA: radical SAM protein [Xanthobacteraceae bacterium]|nr:radical SAM protein [Xanthobacteraceae bacterium]